MWLLECEIFEQMNAASLAKTEISAEQQTEFIGALSNSGNSYSVSGGQAVIPIEGILTEKRDFMAMFFGGGNTLYGDIVSAAMEAEADPKVKGITFEVGTSPGGNINGLFGAIDSLRKITKPITSVVSNLAASATYAIISSVSDKIVALNKGTRTGSVGIIGSFSNDPLKTDITSSKAPKKSPDVSTMEGKAAALEQLDSIHDLFVAEISKGRKTTSAKVNADFGQGAPVLAEEALKSGMIDAIGTSSRALKPARKTAINSGKKTEAKMDLNQLKAEHPDVYAKAVELGVTSERDRAGAHLILGEASGDMATAMEAIKDGSPMTATLSAKYQAAGMNKNDINAREGDNPDPNLGGTDGEPVGTSGDISDKVVSLVEAKMGITSESGVK